MNVLIDISNVTIKTERLILRPFNINDLDDFYEYAKVDGVGQMAGWLPHKNKEESLFILNRFITGKKTFAITLNNKVIGSLGIEEYNEKEFPEFSEMKARELGYVLSRDYWGMGIMTEAVKAVIDYCFNVLKLDMLFCAHFKKNNRSKRVQEKCGFEFYKETKFETKYGEIKDDMVRILFNNSKRPIGVYDSGMGGLIVLEKLIDELPNEDFIFVADNINLPYGTKISDQIEGYNLVISDYLIKQNVKAICIACNTASANSTLLDREIKIPLIKTIEPTVLEVSKDKSHIQNNILILATTLTTKIGVYEKELDKYFKDVPHNYYSKACQNFTQMVEDGRYGNDESLNEVRSTLKDYLDKKIDKIILGCTHFPKLMKEIKSLFPNTKIYSSNDAISNKLKDILVNEKLNSRTKEGSIVLITTGDLDYFKSQTSWFKYKDKAIYKKIDLDFSKYNKTI